MTSSLRFSALSGFLCVKIVLHGFLEFQLLHHPHRCRIDHVQHEARLQWPAKREVVQVPGPDARRDRAVAYPDRADVRAGFVSAPRAGRGQSDGGSDGGATEVLTTDEKQF